MSGKRTVVLTYSSVDTNFLDTAEVAHLDQGIQTVLSTQTPCYTGWQEAIWRSHCNDGCVFLGRVGQFQ